MKKLVIAAAAIAMFSAASAGTVMAKEKANSANAYCSKLAKKHHVTADKMDSYMKTCVEKHEKKHKQLAAKKTAKPAASTPAK